MLTHTQHPHTTLSHTTHTHNSHLHNTLTTLAHTTHTALAHTLTYAYRVLALKALCDLRLDREDFHTAIDTAVADEKGGEAGGKGGRCVGVGLGVGVGVGAGAGVGVGVGVCICAYTN